jgi:DNA repair protein RecO (recombination protein O)
MDWRDEGILLAVRPHGETSAIVETLTRSHGRHAGLVRGGRSAKMSPVLQPGTQLSLEWRARLAEHLGHFRIEPLHSRAGAIMEDRTALAGLNAIGALLVTLLPEREPNPDIYDRTLALADALAGGAWDWPARYAHWEVALLGALGFGLDLTRCGATGGTDDLAYVSPRTGRAVSHAAGGAWADKLLPLPGFLIKRGNPGTGPKMGDVREALRMTGWFLEHWACPALERQALPDARARLVYRFESHEMVAPG